MIFESQNKILNTKVLQGDTLKLQMSKKNKRDGDRLMLIFNYFLYTGKHSREEECKQVCDVYLQQNLEG